MNKPVPQRVILKEQILMRMTKLRNHKRLHPEKNMTQKKRVFFNERKLKIV